MPFLVPFALGWAGGYVAWKALDPSCKIGKGCGKGLYGVKATKRRR